MGLENVFRHIHNNAVPYNSKACLKLHALTAAALWAQNETIVECYRHILESYRCTMARSQCLISDNSITRFIRPYHIIHIRIICYHFVLIWPLCTNLRRPWAYNQIPRNHDKSSNFDETWALTFVENYYCNNKLDLERENWRQTVIA